MNQKIIFGKICLVIFSLFLCAGSALAQIDAVSSTKQKAKTIIKPKAKPVAKKIDFKKKVTIVRVEKKSRKNYKKTSAKKNVKPIVRRIQVPLLAIQLRLMLVNAD